MDRAVQHLAGGRRSVGGSRWGCSEEDFCGQTPICSLSASVSQQRTPCNTESLPCVCVCYWSLLPPLKDTREPLRLPISHLSDSRQTPKFASSPSLLHRPLKTTSGSENNLKSMTSSFPSARNEQTSSFSWSDVWPPAAPRFTLLCVSPSQSQTLNIQPNSERSLIKPEEP